MTLRLLVHRILIAWAMAAPLLAHAGGCIPLRFGYIDQHRPPYYMGDGDKVPEPPGATVDLMRDAAAGAGFGCPPILVRLPPARLRLALATGDIDMTTLGEQPSYPPEIALPRDKHGDIDRNRALGNVLIVLVRARDKVPAGVEPMQYFKGKVLGAAQGNGYTPRLREAGLTVDDGARDVERNIEKLKLRRIDGVVLSAVKPGDVEELLKRHHGDVVQLQQPLVNMRIWLAFNQGYYQAHREQVEAFWTWLDQNRSRLGYVMQKYKKTD
jgi:hypothetical protein